MQLFCCCKSLYNSYTKVYNLEGISMIKIGVSSCLCGMKVRHDGAAKKNAYLLQTLSQYFDFEPHCPEMGAGLGVPRPAMRLQRVGDEIRVIESRNPEADHTDALNDWADKKLPDMKHLDGYVLKNASPSCGMERVKIYDHNNVPTKTATGVFAERLQKMYPNMPVEEEGRLNDPVLRENFIERVYVYNRWQTLMAEGLSVGALMEFHRRHKFILLAHDEKCYRELGPLVASCNRDNLDSLAEQYITMLMGSLRMRASRKRHTNVLMHIFGFIKDKLEPPVKQEVLQQLDKYRTGLVPLVVPLTLIRHYLKQYPNDYMDSQFYLEPYPDELMLRNDV